MPSAVAHEDALQAKYDFSSGIVRGSTQISSRAAALISRLQGQTLLDAEKGAKHIIVALQASARAANKLISIVEIVKRELKNQDKPIFQYTSLSSELIEIKPKRNALLQRAMNGAVDDEEDDGEGEMFEDMNASTTTEQSQSPVLTIYLSSASIPELRSIYSEQNG